MRTLPAGIGTKVADAVLAPVYLVEMSFAVPVYLCSRGSAVYDSKPFADATMNVQLSDPPVLDIFNEATTLGQVVLTEGTSGRRVQIWQSYLDPASITPNYNLTEAVKVFDGEMGTAQIGERVRIQCKQTGPKYAPTRYVQEPQFSHLPQVGAQIRTKTQVITLE